MDYVMLMKRDHIWRTIHVCVHLCDREEIADKPPFQSTKFCCLCVCVWRSRSCRHFRLLCRAVCVCMCVRLLKCQSDVPWTRRCQMTAGCSPAARVRLRVCLHAWMYLLLHRQCAWLHFKGLSVLIFYWVIWRGKEFMFIPVLFHSYATWAWDIYAIGYTFNSWRGSKVFSVSSFHHKILFDYIGALQYVTLVNGR